MSRTLPFTKMHGAGNDYVLFDGLKEDLPDDLSQLARDIAHRNFAVGFDQMLVVRPSTEADFRMDIYNADGSQVEMCGNGIRAFYKYLRDEGHTNAEKVGVETLGGVVYPEYAGEGLVRVDMGLPILIPEKIPTTLATGAGPVLEVPIELPADVVWPGAPSELRASSISMGNPHCVLQVDDIDSIPLDHVGPPSRATSRSRTGSTSSSSRSSIAATSASVLSDGGPERPSPVAPAPARSA